MAVLYLHLLSAACIHIDLDLHDPLYLAVVVPSFVESVVAKLLPCYQYPNLPGAIVIVK